MNLPALPLDALALPLDHSPLDASQVIEGAPTTGYAQLGEIDGRRLGVWEITPSVSRDVEVDEVFVVLEGSATVAFDDGRPPLELRPGVVATLASGDRTIWTVHARFRKVCLTPG